MNKQQLLTYIYEKYDVQNWEISGIQIWPLIRVKLFLGLSIHEMSRGKKGKTKENVWQRLIINNFKKFISALLMLLISFLDYKKNNEVNNETIAIAGYYHLRNIKLSDGSFYNINFDPVIDMLVQEKTRVKIFEYIIWPLVLNKFRRFPRHSASVLIGIKLFTIKMKSLLICAEKQHLRFKQNCIHEYDIFRNDLIEKGISSEYLYNHKELCRVIDYVICLKNFYINNINANTCKLGICAVDGAGLWNQAFFLACRELGIKTVELQHGIINEDNIVFSNWKTNGIGYRNLPDYFFCWDKASADKINKWADRTKYHKAVVVGNLLHEVWGRNIGYEISLCKKKYHSSLHSISKDFSRVILISLQGDNIHFPKYLTDIFSMMTDILWVVRTHPTTSRCELIRVKSICCGRSNVYFDDGSFFPLLSWLDVIDLHVTGFSAIAIEASWQGIPTISVDQTGIVEECFDDLFKKRYLKIAHTKEEFIMYLNTTTRYAKDTILDSGDGKMDFCEIVHNIINEAG